MNTEQILNQLIEITIEYGPKLLGAVVVWIIGVWVIKVLKNGLGKMMDKRKADESLKPFLKGTMNVILKVALTISVLGMLGIEMTIFITLLGAAGLAIGMALSGTLQNFAGGVMLLTFKPFKVGDLIEAQGYLGNVSEIQIFNTILKTLDNKTIIIPNSGLSTSAMTNYSTERNRRVDWIFGIGYGEDTSKAQKVIKDLCDNDSRILKDPEAFIAVSELAESSVNFTVRAWVKTENYWNVFFDMNNNIYKIFKEKGLSIPYPQMDIHIHKK